MDYNAYHPRLIGKLIKFDMPDGNVHEWLAEQYGCSVEESKGVTFQLLYGGIDDDFKQIPYFKAVSDYIDEMWIETQKKGFLQRYSLEDTGTGKTKTFEGKTWYLKKGMATLATPGKSQHNLGIAVDVANAAEPKRLKWLIDNVKKFGFSWEVVPEEPWHLRYVCGDNLPQAVVEYTQRKEAQ
jgi:hypothetical protein